MGVKHPITQRIEEAVELIERVNGEITPSAIKVNVEPKITWADWTPEEAASEALDARIARWLRGAGYVIADAAPREGGRVREGFWTTPVSKLEEQQQIRAKSIGFDKRRAEAEQMVITFLREKERELAYEPYAELFHDEIARIYSMYGMAPPA